MWLKGGARAPRAPPLNPPLTSLQSASLAGSGLAVSQLRESVQFYFEQGSAPSTIHSALIKQLLKDLRHDFFVQDIPCIIHFQYQNSCMLCQFATFLAEGLVVQSHDKDLFSGSS